MGRLPRPADDASAALRKQAKLLEIQADELEAETANTERES